MKKDFIKTMISLFNDNYNTFIAKTILFRPNKFFSFIWTVITGLGLISKRDLDTVIFCKVGEEHKFREIFDVNDMEKLYGGNLSDEPHYKGEYWPPRPSTQGPILTKQDIIDKKLYTFDIISKKADGTIIKPDTKIDWANTS